jgi:hypothetical protein
VVAQNLVARGLASRDVQHSVSWSEPRTTYVTLTEAGRAEAGRLLEAEESRCYWCGKPVTRPSPLSGTPWADQGFCSESCGEQFATRLLGLFGYVVPPNGRGHSDPTGEPVLTGEGGTP